MAGITGVIATSVSQRTQEFGVRIALGAPAGACARSSDRSGLTLVAIGLAIGAAASAPSTRALSAYLFDPRQPIPRFSSPLPYRLSWQPRSRAPGPHGGRRPSIRCRRCAPIRPLARVVGVVVPWGRLRPRNDSCDVRVFTFRGGRLRRLSILRFLASRRLRLLFFLAGAFTRAFVLGRT